MQTMTETGRRFTVLVVDDAADQHEIMNEYLAPLYQVRTAWSGIEALAQANVVPIPDLILLDLMMPGMDGFQVLAALRESPATRDIPVMIVTAAGMEAEEERGFALGAVDFVAKPICPPTLLARVRTHLALAEATRELKVHNDDLEQRIADRTRKLEQAMFAAEAANRAKGEFLRNMSHEIRTPMNGIIGMCDLLLGTRMEPDQREFAGILRSSAGSLASVLNDILSYAKAEADRLEVKTEPFEVDALVREVQALFRPRAAEKQLQFVCSVAPSVPATLVGDAAHIREILLKLVDNAVKFTDRGEVALSVAHETLDAGDALRIEVRDTGIGIAADSLDAIFHPFIQADGSMTRSHGGLGLGLAIVRQRVDLLNGHITLQSSPGAGTWVTVQLPLSMAGADNVLP